MINRYRSQHDYPGDPSGTLLQVLATADYRPGTSGAMQPFSSRCTTTAHAKATHMQSQAGAAAEKLCLSVCVRLCVCVCVYACVVVRQGIAPPSSATFFRPHLSSLRFFTKEALPAPPTHARTIPTTNLT